MQERVASWSGPRARAMWVSTFHSACVRILRAEGKRLGFTSSFSIYDADDSRRLMTTVCRDLDLDPKRLPGAVGQRPGVEPEERAGRLRGRPRPGRRNHIEKTVAEAYGLYQDRLRRANALDFDDLIMTTVTLLQLFPDVAEHYRRRFRHVLVDEYQDTNHAQYVLVRELVGVAGEECRPSCASSGDADQSIYAFRGATIRNILQFEEDYPDATVDPARAELPLDPDDPVRRQRRDLPQPGPQAEAACGPTPATARRSSGTSRTTSTTRRPGSPREIDRLADEAGVRRLRRRGVLPDQRAEPGLRGGLHPGRPAVQGRRRGPLLRAARDPRRAGLPARCSSTPPTPCRCAGSSTCRSAASATRAEAAIETLAERERISFFDALHRAEERPASRPGRSTRSRGS